MRCSSTVSAPVQHCCAPLTAHHSRYVAVQLLTNQVLYFIAETKSKTKDLYAQTCIYLAGQGMLDCELFGLAIMCDGEYLFVDPDSKLSKYAPKNWKSSSSHGLDGHGKPVFVLYFRVQFYVDTPLLLRDDLTRHNYYLQLRDNAVSRGQISFCSSDELLLLLGGYALQADFGDYDESQHKASYFQLEKYFPKELISRNSQIFKMAVALHKDNRGLSTAEAEMQYIKEASSTEITPLTYNLHLYRLKSHKKQEMDRTTVWLAICARGIQIYEETHLKKSLFATFLWNNIGKLCFDRKKFEIKALSASAEKFTYYTSSDDKSKHLLFLCRVTHQYSMAIQSRLSEAKKKEEEEKKRYRDCFTYDRGLTSEFSSLAKINFSNSHYKNMRSDQRISVISNTSSNTTSGIVSDRVQSLDESEELPVTNKISTNQNAVHTYIQYNTSDTIHPKPSDEESIHEDVFRGKYLEKVYRALLKVPSTSVVAERTFFTADDLEIEIMINSPPGNSVESLALAHLRDAPFEDNGSSEPLVLTSEGATGSALPGHHSSQKSSPSTGRGAATPATTDGSQCSSTCSTVVVAGVGISGNPSSVKVSLSGSNLQKHNPRRSSTTSSLELGYSHTAQNSVVSDSISCLEMDLSVQNGQFGLSDKIENDTSKEVGVYSLNTLTKNLSEVKTSNFLFDGTSEVGTDPNFEHESTVSELEITRNSVYGNSNLKNNNIYKRHTTSDLENTHQTESVFSRRIVTHLSNGSDLETTSSGVYTNSNDLDSSRIYSPMDSENSSSEIFTIRSVTEPDLQTNACSSETSGVYLANSMVDTSSTSECCGVYAIMESMRERSGSNASGVSASESFHGDGSDPSEAGRGSLLTAEELSALIVGKTHNSGIYPLRATVSNTLDSDSDYVTLPPPPRPPPRIESQYSASISHMERPHPTFSQDFAKLHLNQLQNENLKRPLSLQNVTQKQLILSQQNLLSQQSQFIDQGPLIYANEPQQYSSTLTTLLAQVRPNSTLPSPIEEANARFITTKPHISMITHSNASSSSVTPNYASPTSTNFLFNCGDPTHTQNDSPIHTSVPANSVSKAYEHTVRSYTLSDGLSSNLNHVSLSQRPYIKNIENNRNATVNNYSIDPTAMKRNAIKNCQFDPGAKMKINSVPIVPIVGKNNYLDIHASKAKSIIPVRTVAYQQTFTSLPPPSAVPRQPPPPPPPLATVYTSQVTRSQIEQFKQQLYSDVDYVIYPMKDPAISKQEYIDAKQGSLLAAMATGYPNFYPPPPPYPSAKTHVVYRSAPNVAIGNTYLPVNFTSQPITNKYSSNTHLNQSSEQLYGYQTYLPQPSHYSSMSPLYSAASYSSSSSQSLRYEPSPMTDFYIPRSLSNIPGNSLSFSRTRSDDNILNTYQKPTNPCAERAKHRRFPPPPPPPPYEMRQLTPVNSKSNTQKEMVNDKPKVDIKLETFIDSKKVPKDKEKNNAKPIMKGPKKGLSPSSSSTKTITDDKGKIIDIHALIEKSKNLDLPLISALCNDKSLIRQTNAFVMPKHPGVGRSSSSHGLKSPKPVSKKIGDKERPSSFHSEFKNLPNSVKPQKISSVFDNSLTNFSNLSKTTKTATLLETLFSGKSSKRYASSSKLKYPVSGLSTTQISKPQRKLSSAHIHPKDLKPGQASIIETQKTQSKSASAMKSSDALVP